MKKYQFLLAFLISVFAASPVLAQSVRSLERDIANLREDLEIMQRKAYEGGGSNAADVQVRLGEMDELTRTMNGKIDSLEYKIKKLEERIEMINKDVDVRIKMIEGKPVETMGAAASQPKTFDAPVAANAPKSLVGESISKGAELEPLSAIGVPEAYQKGQEELKALNYDAAEKTFEEILTNHPNDKLAGNAQYWLGEVYYGKKDFQRAAISFAKGYQNYKGSPKGPDSLLKLGMSMKALKKNPEACAAFTSMDKEFPNAEAGVKNKAKDEAKALKCK